MPFTEDKSHTDCQCRLEWGRRGARRAAERGDILVIVDVLSFTSLVATAVHHGASVFPCTESDDAIELAVKIGGQAAVCRKEVPDKGRFSLSPLTYMNVDSGTKIVVASPNGATCARYSSRAPYVFAGGLLNAAAVGDRVTRLINDSQLSVTVVACGEREREPVGNGPIRWAVEDYLGAGAILSCLPFEMSPDAIVCRAAFLNCRDQLRKIIEDSRSGIELQEMGFDSDIEHSVRLNIYNCAPVLSQGCFVNFHK